MSERDKSAPVANSQHKRYSCILCIPVHCAGLQEHHAAPHAVQRWPNGVDRRRGQPEVVQGARERTLLFPRF